MLSSFVTLLKGEPNLYRLANFEIKFCRMPGQTTDTSSLAIVMAGEAGRVREFVYRDPEPDPVHIYDVNRDKGAAIIIDNGEFLGLFDNRIPPQQPVVIASLTLKALEFRRRERRKSSGLIDWCPRMTSILRGRRASPTQTTTRVHAHTHT